MKIAYFLTNDLRIQNNNIFELIQNYDSLSIFYSFEKDMSQFRKRFVIESLLDLSKSLKNFDQKIYIIDSPRDFFTKYKFDKVLITKSYNNKIDYSFIENISPVENSTLYYENELPFELKDLPKTFTPFRKKVEAHCPQSDNIKLTKLPSPLNFDLPTIEDIELKKADSYFKGGEDEAHKRLQYYFFKTHKVKSYKETRNGMLDFDDSTKFSPWLAAGCISPKRIFHELKSYESKYGSNESTYWVYFELLWRDYFKFLSLKSKDKFFRLSGLQNKTLFFPKDEDSKLKKWIDGQTGDDFVDANMNEIAQTGWMSNRGRQNVASFLTKELGVSWLKGADYFRDQLVDYDMESNYGNWAYLAGVGVDPRDRKFNTQKQAKIYDPDQKYRDKFLS